MIVGIDEAGRGPLCGPVVVCAYYFVKKDRSLPIKDSKKLSSAQRQELFNFLLERGIFSLSLSTPYQIDKYNIRESTNLAFNQAIKKIVKKASFLKEATFIIDGTYFQPRLKMKISYRCLKKADEKIEEVASASILAKVFRDYLMGVLDFLYPEWGFLKHKGYPTPEHRELMKRLVPTPFHRKSFCKSY